MFYCYSRKLKDELLENGFSYLHYAQHFKTNKLFWVFEGNGKLNEFLEARRSRQS